MIPWRVGCDRQAALQLACHHNAVFSDLAEDGQRAYDLFPGPTNVADQAATGACKRDRFSCAHSRKVVAGRPSKCGISSRTVPI